MKRTRTFTRRTRHHRARAPRRRGLLLAGAAAAGATAAMAARVLRSRRPETVPWYAVTVEADPAALTGRDRPDLLARLAERHEIRISRAPGGRGTEIAVRTADGATREQVRALKQLLETGEVLRVEGQPEGRRTAFGRTAAPVIRHLTRRGPR
ncbi:hypothetical protein AB0K67_09930 [Nonomuraea sp. NPDC052634]|uniref:hypothetical protein n=1 Tax=Nonomuraea sp. NPDC052634 TaxID=3155813 RepID=UPI0034227953